MSVHNATQLIQQALQLHQQGQLAPARQLYMQVLKDNPQHVDALHLLGVCEAFAGNHQQAMQWMQQAIAIDPNHASIHCNYGNVLRNLGQLQPALASYERALELNPNYAEAYSNRGIVLRELKRLDEALACYERALELNPNYVEAHSNYGVTLHDLGRFEEALNSHDNALKLNKNYPKALLNRGITLRKLGRLQEALQNYQQSIALKPDNANAYSCCGVVLQELERHEEALQCYEQALVIDPQLVDVYFNRGITLYELGQQQAALESYQHALNIQPNYVEAYSGQGLILQEQGQNLAALDCYNQAISLNRDNLDAYNNRGTVLSDMGRTEEAMADYDYIISRQANNLRAHSNRGVLLHTIGEHDAAMESYKTALNIDAKNPAAQFGKGLLHLQLGEFTEGWRLYEWRWQRGLLKLSRRKFSQPLWLGNATLNGKTILLHSEQGLGDNLQFCRYIPMVKALGAKVVVEVEEVLRGILASLNGVDVWVNKGQNLPPFDYHCPFLSLPLACNTFTVSDIPANIPYLASPAHKVKAWAERLGTKGNKPRVGLVWSGGFRPHQREYRNVGERRDIDFAMLACLNRPDIDFYSLQKGEPAESILLAQRHSVWPSDNLHIFSADLNDLTDTAALIEHLDLVICVDTAITHLAGALGKPVWLLNRFDADWRWLLGRNDSPWYPSLRIFQQSKAGDWGPVISAVQQALMQQYPSSNKVLIPVEATHLTGLPQPKSLATLEQALTLYKQGQLVTSRQLCEEILQVQPQQFEVMHLLGMISYQSGDYKVADQWLTAALELNNTIADVYCNRGLARSRLEQPEAALEDYDIAIKLNPKHAHAYYNRGLTLTVLGRIEASLHSQEQAIACDARLAVASFSKAISLLTLGKFTEGWPLLEKRWQCADFPTPHRQYKQPLWRGEDLFNKTIFLHSEQGLGDTLQFCRYVRHLKALGATVIVEAERELLGILATLQDVDQLLEKNMQHINSTPQHFDYHCPLLSLPLLCKTWSLSDIPAEIPYLFANPQQVLVWQKKLGAKTKPRVGLVWQGNLAHKQDGYRSMPLAQLCAALPDGLEYISLQKELRSDDLEWLNKHSAIRHFGDELHDFTDTAALCNLVDLVVCVDTSITHLAGALGVATWVLLPFSADWRWLLERDDSPWYPTMRLFRQTQRGDWSSVLKQVQTALLEWQHSFEHLHVQIRHALQQHQQGQLASAREMYTLILKKHPKYFDALHLLGVLEAQTGHTQLALSLLEQALCVSPQMSVVHCNYGNVLRNSGRLEESLRCYERALELQPNYAEAYSNRGITLKELGRSAEALASYEHAIKLKPDYAEAYSNCGVELHEWGRLEDALNSYQKAILLNSNYSEAYSNRGLIYQELGQLELAREDYERAINLKPDNAEAHSNLGMLCHILQQSDLAAACFRRSLAIKADYANAHFGQSLLDLQQGNFASGWAGYEWRWQGCRSLRHARPKFSQALWLGQFPVHGKTILLWSEQGIGDNLQFCRYVAQVKALGARIVLVVESALLGILASLSGVDLLIAKGQALPDFDYYCPVLSLPLACKTLTVSDIPVAVPYLFASPTKLQVWEKRLGEKTKPRVGLVWQGNLAHKQDGYRSMPLAQLCAALPDGLEYISLQKELRSDDLAWLNQHSVIRHFGDELDDFTDTAALCGLMDLVVCVDTSVTHLAGALGLATWVLLPFNADWRWLLDRTDSPWYPTLRLFRQPKLGDWQSVLESVQKALTTYPALQPARTKKANPKHRATR